MAIRIEVEDGGIFERQEIHASVVRFLITEQPGDYIEVYPHSDGSIRVRTGLDRDLWTQSRQGNEVHIESRRR